MLFFCFLVAKRLEEEPRKIGVLMADLATFNFKLSQLYPGAGEHHLNTCANPHCSNFGQALTSRARRRVIGKIGDRTSPLSNLT